jgi:riboflavin kinase/FMN adenylyltransferase
MHTLLIGYDNKIGKNREGTYEKLEALGKQKGFNTQLLDVLQVSEEKLSSTTIREHLTQGKILEAAKLLGYPYLLSGEVVHGKQLGNKLGFPTANILPSENKFIPANGVYAIVAELDNKQYKGMMNIGLRPTINDGKVTPVIEAHLFDFNANLYGKFLTIKVMRKLRNEYKFESIDALREQLKKDKDFALETLQKEFLLD